MLEQGEVLLRADGLDVARLARAKHTLPGSSLALLVVPPSSLCPPPLQTRPRHAAHSAADTPRVR